MKANDKRFIIDTKEGLTEALYYYGQVDFSGLAPGEAQYAHKEIPYSFESDLFCPKCGERRKCSVEIAGYPCTIIKNEDKKEFQKLPIVYRAKCFQCDKEAILVLYEGPEKTELAVLRNTYGGGVTENTPEEVKYYIDQASRSRMMGALSASMAMYRSALEWILYEQGYVEGMLGKKIDKMEEDIKNGEGPNWIKILSTEMITAIKNIGNSSMHTNNGEISKQKVISKELLEVIDIVFAELLDIIYEAPKKRESALKKLKDAENILNSNIDD